MADLSYLLGPTEHLRQQRSLRIAETTNRMFQEDRRRMAAQAVQSLDMARRFGPKGQTADRAATLRNSAAVPPGLQLRDAAVIDPLSAQMEAARELDYLAAHPRTAQFIADYDRAIAVHDDVETIGGVESMLGALSRSVDRAWDGLVLGYREKQAAREETSYRSAQMTLDEILSEERGEARAEQGQAAATKYQRQLEANPPAQAAGAAKDAPSGEPVEDSELSFTRGLSADAQGLWRWIRSRNMFSDETVKELEAASGEKVAGALREQSFESEERALLWETPQWRRKIEADISAGSGATAGDGIKTILRVAGDNPWRFVQYMLEIGAESGVTLAVGTAVGVATRNPYAAAAAMGAASYSVSDTVYFEELVHQYGHDLSTRAGVKEFLEDPRTRLDLRDKSKVYGIVVGTLDALSGGVAGKMLVNNPAGNMLVQMIAQSVLGGGGELLGRLAADEEVDWNEVILEAIAETVTAPIEVLGMGGTIARRKVTAVAAMKERRKLFEILGGTLSTSKLRARDRETFKAAIDAVTKGGPSENVYVDPDAVEKLFQSTGQSIKDFFEAVPELDLAAFEQARDTGDFYVIPTSVYAASVAGSDIGAALMDYIKLDPNDVTTAEAKVFARDLDDAKRELSTNADKLATVIGEIEGPLADEMERITSEIMMSSGFSPDIAAKQAAPLIAAARVGSIRTGMPIGKYLERYTLPMVRNRDTVGAAPAAPLLDPGAVLEAVQSDTPASDSAFAIGAVREHLDNKGIDVDVASYEDVREALRELIKTGAVSGTLPIEDQATPTSVERATDDEYMQTATIRSGLESAADWGIDVKAKNKIRDIALKLQERQRTRYGKTSRSRKGPQTIVNFGEWMADEIEFELQTPSTSAKGWYGPKFQAALDKLGEAWAPLVDETAAKSSKIPGVSSVADARALATAIFAVSSNGTKVIQNVDNALALLLTVEQDGALIEAQAHHRGAALNDHVKTMFRLAAEMGGVGMQQHLTEELTMGQINTELRAAKKSTKSGYPAAMTVPRAAQYLGPKLAAFYANLTGNEGYLTMDLWWTRTINRYRGDVLPRVSGLKNAVDTKGRPIGLHRFKVLINRPDLTDRQALNIATEYAAAYERKDYKNGTEAEKAANTLYKAAFVKLAETPDGAADRTFMIEVAKSARQQVFERTGEMLTIADVQALMWYYEKRLYAEMGVRDSGDLSYLEAADAVVKLTNMREAMTETDLADYEDPNAFRFGPDQETPEERARVDAIGEEFFQTPLRPTTGNPVSKVAMSPVLLKILPQEALDHQFSRDGWFVVTATRSEYGEFTTPENTARNEALEAQIKEAGLDYHKLSGVYAGTPDGPSFMVFAPEDVGIRLGTEWGQESILNNRGLVYTDGSGTPPVPFSGVVFGAPADIANDFYSVFADSPDFGFSMNLMFPEDTEATVEDGDGSSHYGARVEDDGKILLTHWSKEPLSRIDPSAANFTNSRRGPEYRRHGPQKSFYGLHIGRPGGYVKEGLLGSWRHEVRVDPKDLYSWWEDPDGLRAKLDKTKGEEYQVGAYEFLIKEAGYKGYFVIGGDLGDTAVLFGEVEPETVIHDRDARAQRSAAFEEWFGESVVRNADGSPRMVYHGTRSRDFSRFFPLSHFGSARAARQRLQSEEAFDPGRLEKGLGVYDRERIIPVYLSIQNPLHVGREQGVLEDFWETTVDMLRQAADHLPLATKMRAVEAMTKTTVHEQHHPAYFDDELGEEFAERTIKFTLENLDRELVRSGRDAPSHYIVDPAAAVAAWEAAINDVLEIFREAGYDGVTYVNGIEDEGVMSYIPFASNQVKSPFNQGSWDMDTADILFQTNGPTEPTTSAAFRAWFAGSKVVDEQGKPLRVYHGTETEWFDEFDTYGRGRTEGTGAFFTSSRDLAGTYTKSFREARLPTLEEVIKDYQLIVTDLGDGTFAVTAPDFDTDLLYTGSTRDEALQAAYDDFESNGEFNDNRARMYEVYLSIKDPFVLDAHGANWSAILAYDVHRVLNEDGDLVGYVEDPDMVEDEFGAGDFTTELIDPAGDDVYGIPEQYLVSTNDLVRMGRDMGADGVIIKNVRDGGTYSRGGEIGDVYVAFEPTQVKATANSGEWNPRTGYIFGQQANGSIILPKTLGTQAVIQLFETANLSTMHHETGHYFLWQLQMQANDGHQFAIDEMKVVTDWWMKNAAAIAKEAGVDQAQVEEYLTVGSTGQGDVDREIHTALHEQFARGYEAYGFEGKSPSNAMRALFEDFSAWLMSWYKSLKSLNVNINDDIRGVYDRLLATEEELLDAAEREEINDMIAVTAKEMGLDEDSYRRLVALSQEARDEGRQIARAEFLATEKRIRSADYQARFAEIDAEERAKVIDKPVHRAIQWLAYGRWLAGDTPDQLPLDLRMDTELLVEEHGPEILDKLPRGRRPVYKKDTGLSADEVGGWFGFNSGAEMLKAMVDTPSLTDEVKANVEARARQELGDPLTDPDSVAVAVADAYHGEKRGQVIVAEMRAINRLGGKGMKPTSRAQARAIASDLIWRMPVREATQSQRYLAAERGHAETAARLLAAGNIEGAFDAKRKQLIQHAMYSESRKVAELQGQAERLAGRLKRKGTRENLAPEYLGAIDDILETYDFRKVSGKAEVRRERLNAYVQMMTQAGRENELAIPDHVLQNAQRVPYRTLTARRLQGVYDTLRNIEHTARWKQKLRVAAEERQFQEVRDEISGQFAANVNPRRINRSPTKVDGLVSGLRGYINLVRNADTVLRKIDGWESRGSMVRLFKQDIDDAGIRAKEMRDKATEDLDDIFSTYGKAERRQMAVRKVWPGYAQALSKWDVISIALNMGNKDNRQRLTAKDSRAAFSEAEVDALIDTLDKRDCDFVQKVWDYLDSSYWPQIRDRELRATGVAPAKVEAMPFQTKFGEYRGGYYPIAYDRRFSAKVSEDQNKDLATAMMAGRFGKAQTKNGHTKERAAGGGGRTVELGMHVLFGHINNVIHDLAYGEAVATTWKLLQDGEIKGLFEEYGMLEDHQALELWVQDTAAGPGAGTHVLARTAKRLKSGFTLSKLAFNLSTVAIQVTGITQSMATIGSVNMGRGIVQYVASGTPFWTLAEQVKARSTFMREREETFQRDAYDIARDVQVNPLGGIKTDVMRFIMQAGFYAMQKVQFYGVDMPTWLGAHTKGLNEGMSEADAARYADRMVARAQASGLYADRTAIERGTLGTTARQNEFLRLFTALGSYMFAKYNVAEEVVGRASRDIKNPDASTVMAVLKASTDLVLLFTVEAILYNAIKMTLPGMGDDADEDQRWITFLAAETALSVASVFPFARDVSSAVQGFGGGGSYGGISETFGRSLASVGDIVTGDASKGDARALVDLGGLMAPGIPSTAIWRLIDGAGLTGEEPSPMAAILGR